MSAAAVITVQEAPRFILGHVHSTYTVRQWADGSTERGEFIIECLVRHLAGDWGEVDRETMRSNEYAVQAGTFRIASAYPIPSTLGQDARDDELWLITTAGHAATTILFPSEY